MNLKLTRSLTWLAIVALAFSFVAPFGSADAVGDVYVNNSQSVLGVDIGSAYAVGSGGSIATVGDTYVLTDSGTVKVGQANSVVPSGEEDGTTIKVTTTTARIGLYYYYSTSRDTALTSANLENSVGSGYLFGYYDSNRVFYQLGSTAETKLTMKPTGSGREVSVYKTGTETLLYKHSNTTYNLAVRPVSTGGKAQTWFKSNTYYGDFEYYRYISDKLTVINVLDVEDYVKGVVPIEMSSSWPLEALKAQAVCARTYFAKGVNMYSKYGFDLTADTYCQAYTGTGRASANSDNAVDSTKGKYVTYNGAMCDTLYYSSNGGGSENNENVNVAAIPYLRGVLDPYEKDAASINGYSSWTRTKTKTEIASKIVASGKTFGTLASMSATYSATSNVIGLTFTDTEGRTVSYSANACFTFIYSTGRLSLPSIHFTFTDKGDSIEFSGSGWGHNVGMSQFGAYSMAMYHGFNYLQIIRYYYTGVNVSTGV